MININSTLRIMKVKEGPRNTAHSSAETIIFYIMSAAVSQDSAAINP